MKISCNRHRLAHILVNGEENRNDYMVINPSPHKKEMLDENSSDINVYSTGLWGIAVSENDKSVLLATYYHIPKFRD